jgi:hypothetical protein
LRTCGENRRFRADTGVASCTLVTTVHSLVHAVCRDGRVCDREQQIDEITRVVFGYVNIFDTSARTGRKRGP